MSPARARAVRISTCAAISAPPLAVYFIAALFGPNAALMQPREIGWTVALVATTFVMSLAANAAWTYVDRRGEMIDGVFNRNAKTRIQSWFTRSYKAWKQWVTISVSVVAAIVFLIAFRSQIEVEVSLPFASYFTVAWTTWVGANCLYWMVVAPTVIRAMSESRALKLYWFDPATTPGLRMLAKGVSWAGVCLALGSLAIFALGFIAPETVRVKAVSILLLAIAAVAVILLIQSSVVPLIYIVKMAERRKFATLKRIESRINPMKRNQADLGLTDDQVKLIELYRLTSEASIVPFSTGSLLQYGAVVAGGLLAPIVGVIDGIVNGILRN